LRFLRVSMSADLISIAELSASANVSTRVIRHYESIGLLEAIRKGNYRWFDANSLEILGDVRLLLRIGFSLQEIGVLMGKDLKETSEFKLGSCVLKRKDLLARIFEVKKISEKMLKKYEKL